MEEKKNQALNDAVENEENVAVAAESGPASDDLCLTDEEKGKLLVVRNLKKYFPLKTDFFGRPLSYVRAVDDVSFTVEAGKTIGYSRRVRMRQDDYGAHNSASAQRHRRSGYF